MLHSLPDCALSPNLEGAEIPAAIYGSLGKIAQGLYVFRFVNDVDEDVFDRNKRPKIVVHRCGCSLKAGKFEGRFERRVLSYNRHLHWNEKKGQLRGALRECWRQGWVLDLSSAAKAMRKPARIFERYWTESIIAYLKDYQLLAQSPIRQNNRAEWRFLQAERWTSEVATDFRAFLEGVSTRIFSMVDVGRFPARDKGGA